MWPDRSNAAAKHLRKLQKAANPDSLVSQQFAKSSVAIQGLSAMERLIYAKKISFKAFQNNEKANFKCHLSQAISLNVVMISKELLEAWQGDYREVIAKPSKDNDFFETDQEVAAQFLNELNTQLQVIIDQKFNRPIDTDKFRLTRAESWRSQRSLKNISINLQSTQRLYQIAFVPNIADKTLIKTQNALFDAAIKAGETLNIPLTTAYSDKKAELEAWINAIKTLKSSITTTLPAAIGIQLGFNSLDGD
jgi:predicted lipoprotein